MNANELADKLLEDLREVDLFNMDSDMYGNRQHYIEQLESLIRQQQAEIEEWKRKYRDMHNLATQAMSRVHELEKAQKK